MVKEKTFTAKLKVKYAGKNQFILHKQLGKGNLPDGRECRLIETNSGIYMEVKIGEEGWEHYEVTWMDISKAIADIIPKSEIE